MSELRKVAQQALEALERGETKLRWAAITALRAALLADVTPAQMAHADAVAEPEQDDPALTYCHRFAILMECVMLGGVDKHWNEMGALLDEYNTAQHKWREAHGEPYVSGFGKD